MKIKLESLVKDIEIEIDPKANISDTKYKILKTLSDSIYKISLPNQEITISSEEVYKRVLYGKWSEYLRGPKKVNPNKKQREFFPYKHTLAFVELIKVLLNNTLKDNRDKVYCNFNDPSFREVNINKLVDNGFIEYKPKRITLEELKDVWVWIDPKKNDLENNARYYSDYEITQKGYNAIYGEVTKGMRWITNLEALWYGGNFPQVSLKDIYETLLKVSDEKGIKLERKKV